MGVSATLGEIVAHSSILSDIPSAFALFADSFQKKCAAFAAIAAKPTMEDIENTRSPQGKESLLRWARHAIIHTAFPGGSHDLTDADFSLIDAGLRKALDLPTPIDIDSVDRVIENGHEDSLVDFILLVVHSTITQAHSRKDWHPNARLLDEAWIIASRYRLISASGESEKSLYSLLHFCSAVAQDRARKPSAAREHARLSLECARTAVGLTADFRAIDAVAAVEEGLFIEIVTFACSAVYCAIIPSVREDQELWQRCCRYSARILSSITGVHEDPMGVVCAPQLPQGISATVQEQKSQLLSLLAIVWVQIGTHETTVDEDATHYLAAAIRILEAVTNISFHPTTPTPEEIDHAIRCVGVLPMSSFAAALERVTQTSSVIRKHPGASLTRLTASHAIYRGCGQQSQADRVYRKRINPLITAHSSSSKERNVEGSIETPTAGVVDGAEHAIASDATVLPKPVTSSHLRGDGSGRQHGDSRAHTKSKQASSTRTPNTYSTPQRLQNLDDHTTPTQEVSNPRDYSNAEVQTPYRSPTISVPSRNDPCPCGSGTKYKRCCGIAKRR